MRLIDRLSCVLRRISNIPVNELHVWRKKTQLFRVTFVNWSMELYFLEKLRGIKIPFLAIYRNPNAINLKCKFVNKNKYVPCNNNFDNLEFI